MVFDFEIIEGDLCGSIVTCNDENYLCELNVTFDESDFDDCDSICSLLPLATDLLDDCLLLCCHRM